MDIDATSYTFHDPEDYSPHDVNFLGQELGHEQIGEAINGIGTNSRTYGNNPYESAFDFSSTTRIDDNFLLSFCTILYVYQM